MEVNKQDVIKRMQDKDYVKAHREYSRLVEKIENFLEDNGEYVTDLLEAQKAYYKNEMNSVSASFQLQSLQMERTPQSREKISEKLILLLGKVEEQKKFISTIKEEYQEKFPFDEWEKKLFDLQQKIENNSLEDIPLPPQGRKKNPYIKKSTPIRNPVSLPTKGFPGSGGFR